MVKSGIGLCKQCGEPTDWDNHEGGYEAYCGHCYDVMAEREAKRRDWEHWHDGEPCPEIELPAMPARK